jgi:hypothetical protein
MNASSKLSVQLLPNAIDGFLLEPTNRASSSATIHHFVPKSSKTGLLQLQDASARGGCVQSQKQAGIGVHDVAGYV